MMGRSVEKKYSHRVGSVNLLRPPDDFEVGSGIAEGVESFDIVEPELDDAVGLPEQRPLGPVAGDVALDVAAT